MLYECKQCQSSFKAPPSQNARFCSRKCYDKSREGIFKCDNCKKQFTYYKSHKKGKYVFCNDRCQRKFMTGNKHPRWKGGRNIKESGHILIYIPKHPFAINKYIPEHRLIMERKIGRYLRSDEIVHHINHDKTDNRIENLIILTRQEHVIIHSPHG